MATVPATLWEVHIRVPPPGMPLAIICKRGGERVTRDIERFARPCDALRWVDLLLEPFGRGDQLFVTARGHDAKLSMWTTGSRSTGLYWCAAAITKLWLASQRPSASDSRSPSLTVQQDRTVA